MVKIFVGNLGLEATSSELQMLFEKFGRVSECDVKKNYGFVHMPYEEDADVAIEALNEYLLHGVRMKVEKSHGKPGGGSSGVRERSRKTIKIFVGNLHQQAKSQELHELFVKFGKVMECDVMKNYGFVHMEKEEDAKVAIEELNGYELHGAEMKVEMSHSKPSRTDSNRSLKTVKLFIGNVNPQTSSQELQELFEKFGNVTECEVKRNYGFVHMDAVEDALSAIDALHEYQLHGSNIKVEMSKAKPSAGFHPAYVQPEEREWGRPVKLFIGNLSQETAKDELQTLFEKFGVVAECDIIKNYGFVHMEKDEDATAAIDTLSDCYLHGCKMRVERSQPKSRDSGNRNRDGRGDYEAESPYGGGYPDREYGRPSAGRFEPYSRREERAPYGVPYERSYSSEVTGYGRDPFKQSLEFPSRRTPGFGRSAAAAALPPPPPLDSGYDHEGEYERYLRWRNMEWNKFWKEESLQATQEPPPPPPKISRFAPSSQQPKPLMGTRQGRPSASMGKLSTFTPQQTSLYTAFE